MLTHVIIPKFSDIGVEIDFLPIVFSQDNIFFELFSITVQLFNTTWHEMFAKISDFNKVRYLMLHLFSWYYSVASKSQHLKKQRENMFELY